MKLMQRLTREYGLALRVIGQDWITTVQFLLSPTAQAIVQEEGIILLDYRAL